MSKYDLPPIPDFLLVKNRVPRVTVLTTKKARSPRERRQDKPRGFHVPKGGYSPEALQLLKEIEAAKKAKQDAHFAALRERSRR
jgi:hypothetical protein